MKKRIQGNGLIIALAVITVFIFPWFFLRPATGTALETAISMGGLSLMLLGQIVRVSARGYKATFSRGGNTLLKTGPYALVRNPMYLGIVLVGVGVVVFLFNWWMVCVFLVVFIVRYTVLIAQEEKHLLLSFPDEYPRYRRSVARLMPSFAGMAKKDIVQYLPLQAPWLKKEAISISSMLLGVLLVKMWGVVVIQGWQGLVWQTALFLAVICCFSLFVWWLNRRTKEQRVS
ncbi:MAG: isoprenylcysteine carboxylmethyltransferase family protein [Candidatus Omnitrophica bacterium]|nr:isoprenylcysteine carboxylmethyltransferase family protein [Candidatus Omnitrophota bacterium]